MRREQRTQHEETAVGKIDDARDAKNQRQAGGHQEQRGGVGQAAEELQRPAQCANSANEQPKRCAAACNLLSRLQSRHSGVNATDASKWLST